MKRNMRSVKPFLQRFFNVTPFRSHMCIYQSMKPTAPFLDLRSPVALFPDRLDRGVLRHVKQLREAGTKP